LRLPTKLTTPNKLTRPPATPHFPRRFKPGATMRVSARVPRRRKSMFASTLVREFLPRALKNGLTKGAAAGRNAARSAADQWQPAPS
jgi:hypothetical protein